jgi:Regulator of chromosome condensation (RCC1) repeat
MFIHLAAERRLPRVRFFSHIARAGPLLVVAVFASCRDRPDLVGPVLDVETAQRLVVVTPGTYSQLAGGAAWWHTCGLRSDGVAECWGSDYFGQAPAAQAPLVGEFTQLGTGRFFTCGLRSDGVAECWGRNEYGQAPATRSAISGTFTEIGVGAASACGLRSDGVAECWGYNNWGQAPATRASTSGAFTQLASGGFHLCGLRADGVAECWGYNVQGQAPATHAPAVDTYTALAAGEYHTCGLRSDGVAECWGYNVYGQAPATRSAVTGSFTQLTAGEYHSCGLRSDGVAECWGLDNYGQAPATRAPITGSFSQLAGGRLHTCGRRADGVAECWGRNDDGQAPATRGIGSVIAHVLPIATFGAPTQAIAGQSFVLALSAAQVPGHPEATSFTYAFDCDDGTGYTAPSGTPDVSCPTSTVGSRNVRGKVIDQDSDFAEYTATVAVIWQFTGFFQPVDNPPTLNVANAGRAIPVKFELGGYYGLNILETGYPQVLTVSCSSGTWDTIEQTVTAGGSSLSYDTASQQYHYVWKTDKAWTGSCRQLVVKFIDGTSHRADFRFQ